MATSNGTKEKQSLTKDQRAMIIEALEMKITSLERGQARAAKPIADAIEGVIQQHKGLALRIQSEELDL